jgi:hypothetical protein
MSFIKKLLLLCVPLTSFSIAASSLSFHYIAPIERSGSPTNATENMQAEFGGRVVVLKNNRLQSVIEKENVPYYLDEFNIPDYQECELAQDGSFERPIVFNPRPVINLPRVEGPVLTTPIRNFDRRTFSKPAGMDLLPRMDASWSGSGNGGCGTWSTMMCNRILGKVNKNTAPTRREWNTTARGINQDRNGGSTTTGRSNYYERAGYCASFKKFDGNRASYQEMAKKKKQGCDVKLAFWRKTRDGRYVDGHVEVVTSVNLRGRPSATTNSWGKRATVQGGSNGGFSHSEDRRGGHFRGGTWPAGSTYTRVEYYCKCSTLQSLAKVLGLR